MTAVEVSTLSEYTPRPSTSSTAATHSLDLPSLQPLSHDHPLLVAPTFDVDAFLLTRIHIPLDELRGELRSYLAVLREELVQLINDDYEEFISLGTGLRGEGERLKRLQRPLGTLRGEVEVVRDVLKEHQQAVHAKLDERAALREEKALLDLLQRLFETLSRAEALAVTGDDDERPKIVLRLAGEYTQLVYLRDKALAEQCKIAETVSGRIDSIRKRLSNELSSIITAALETRDEQRIRQCLRTYDLIEGWSEAEDVVRNTVKAFCRKTITSTSLIVPPSPMVPETPYHSSNPFDKSNRLADSSLLGGLYNRILSQVETYQPLLSLANAVSPHFDFFSRVLWPEISSAIIENIGNVVFAAGRPDELHKHYTTTHQFLNLLEANAPTSEAVIAMRESSDYTAFERRWQLPVYFQLRWKEIVSSFETSLASSSGPSASTSSEWALSQSEATWEAFRQCWSPGIYIQELSHRFWRLSLQIISRYGGWLGVTLDLFNTTEEDQSQDDALLRFSASAILDIDYLTSQIGNMEVFSNLGIDVPLQLSTDPFADRIVSILSVRCAESLKIVRSVASQFRAAPGKASAESQPSYFIATILKPLHAFFDGRAILRNRYGAAWSTQVVEHVLSNYAQILASVRKTEDLLRRHRKSKKNTFSLFSSSATSIVPDSGEEEERFKRQMQTDINALAVDAGSFGVAVHGLSAWAELKDVVERPAE